MRIDDASRLSQSPSVDRAQLTNQERAQGTGTKADGDHAHISDLAKALETTGSNEKRIEALRIQVQAGQYQVSAPELAGNILDSHIKA